MITNSFVSSPGCLHCSTPLLDATLWESSPSCSPSCLGLPSGGAPTWATTTPRPDHLLGPGEPGSRIGHLCLWILLPWAVSDVKIQFLQDQSPSSELSRGVRGTQAQRLEGFMICDRLTLVAIQVLAEMFDCPNKCKGLQTLLQGCLHFGFL